jgi:hypothetical protein
MTPKEGTRMFGVAFASVLTRIVTARSQIVQLVPARNLRKTQNIARAVLANRTQNTVLRTTIEYQLNLYNTKRASGHLVCRLKEGMTA